jgi:geranylgeranyl diphosphate synthase type II
MITFEEALATVQREIESVAYPARPAGLYEPVKYLLSMKGKKIRPALTLLACNLWKDDISAALYPALAWETFHNFTLMHDDLMDRADLRRGCQTVHKKWNDNTAILSGDAMLIFSYIQMTKSAIEFMPSLLDLFSTTAAEICEGQQYDMEFENRADISEKEYIEMIRLKTAVMLGACLKSGAIVGGANERDSELMYSFGINLGIAFQIKDDLLDVYGDPAVFGKKTGGDILCDKKTFLLVKTLETVSESEKQELLSRFGQTDRPEEKIVWFKSLYNKLNIKTVADNTVAAYYTLAMETFDRVSVCNEKKYALKKVAENLMNRVS